MRAMSDTKTNSEGGRIQHRLTGAAAGPGKRWLVAGSGFARMPRVRIKGRRAGVVIELVGIERAGHRLTVANPHPTNSAAAPSILMERSGILRSGLGLSAPRTFPHIHTKSHGSFFVAVGRALC